jgi:hypothetical protein
MLKLFVHKIDKRRPFAFKQLNICRQLLPVHEPEMVINVLNGALPSPVPLSPKDEWMNGWVDRPLCNSQKEDGDGVCEGKYDYCYSVTSEIVILNFLKEY